MEGEVRLAQAVPWLSQARPRPSEVPPRPGGRWPRGCGTGRAQSCWAPQPGARTAARRCGGGRKQRRPQQGGYPRSLRPRQHLADMAPRGGPRRTWRCSSDCAAPAAAGEQTTPRTPAQGGPPSARFPWKSPQPTLPRAPPEYAQQRYRENRPGGRQAETCKGT